MPEILFKVVPAAVIVLLIVVVAMMGYIKAPPDTAYIISGFRKNPRVLIGRAGVKIPFLERKDSLALQMISVDVKTTDFVPNLEYINVKVDATVKIRVGRTPEMMEKAMANFLNADEDEIINKVQDTLEGNMREIVGQMRLSEMVTDRKAFADRVQDNAKPDLERMGLELISFNVQSFSDEGDVITNLGIDNVEQIRKSAQIAKAQAKRDIEVAEAAAQRESNEARVASDLAIAEKNTELAMRKADLKAQQDVAQEKAEAAGKIQAQEQEKVIQTTTVDAQIARAEREATLKEKEVTVRRQALDAEVRATADAELYKQQREADADLYQRQRQAEAEKFEAQQQAEAARIAAEAERFRQEQQAAGIAAVGKAEAEAIQAKALAEAEGIDKKAEAMAKYGQAAIVEMVVGALPEIARNVAEPLSKVDKITMYGEGNSAKLLADIVNGTNQVTEGIATGMGLDLRALLAGALGGKMASSTPPVIIQTPPPSEKNSEDALDGIVDEQFVDENFDV